MEEVIQEISKSKECYVNVQQMEQDNVNKGIIMVDEKVLKELGMTSGDPIEILGKRRTAGISVSIKANAPTIQLDSLTRRNSDTLVGNRVTVRKAHVRPAESITLCPAEKDIEIDWDKNTEKLRKNLLGRVVTSDDIITLGGNRDRKEAMAKSTYMQKVSAAMKDTNGYKLTELMLLVENTSPVGVVVIDQNTKLNINKISKTVDNETEVYYDDIGGLGDTIRKIRELVEMPFYHPEVFDRLGITPPNGILLYGPPGTGKTLLAKAVATETKSFFKKVDGPELTSKFQGESESNLRGVFEEAVKKAPSIIFFDELDAIAEKRDNSNGVDKKIVAQLLTLMDGIKENKKVIVIGATNRVDAIDPALRRPGRFDRELEIGAPTELGRLEILKIHTRGMPLHDDVNLQEIARKTHGYVGADIAALCRETAMNVLRKVIPNYDKDEKIPLEKLNDLYLTQKDFNEAIIQIRPSAMRELTIERPTAKWDDIGGLKSVKQKIKEAVEWPLKKADSLKRLGIKSPKGVILYGPPGTGKTLLAKAIANETEANFISVKGPELKSMWVGKSEENVRLLFQKAKQNAPCIIFFDEIDALVGQREAYGSATETASIGIVQQILTEMDGLEELKGVVVIGATNKPELIDPAFLRPGRIDKIIEIPLPDEIARLEIFKIHTKNMKLASDVKLIELAVKTEGYSGADICAICMEAGLTALREDEDATVVTRNNFIDALDCARKSTSETITKPNKSNKLDLVKNITNMMRG